MTPFRVLYLDMNSFFASVEQHLDPALCGRPVAITAVDSEAGACVAASYETKAHGVEIGTHLLDTQRTDLCRAPLWAFRSTMEFVKCWRCLKCQNTTPCWADGHGLKILAGWFRRA